MRPTEEGGADMAEAEQIKATETPPALAEALERVMANPELIRTVAAALGKAPPREAPSETEGTPPEATKTSPPSLDSVATLAPLLAGLKGGISKPPEDDRTRLLCALKPYVNPHRRDTIDTLLRFSQIAELLRHLN
jgi:hypothetical protein